jgi:hypothetical protein
MLFDYSAFPNHANTGQLCSSTAFSSHTQLYCDQISTAACRDHGPARLSLSRVSLSVHCIRRSASLFPYANSRPV